MGPEIIIHYTGHYTDRDAGLHASDETDRDAEGVAIVVAKGHITFGAGTNALRQAREALVSRQQKRIVVDLEDVANIDSSAVGELAALHEMVHAYGGDVKLAKMTRRVMEVLKQSNLQWTFDIFDDETAAVCSFATAEDDAPPEMFIG